MSLIICENSFNENEYLRMQKSLLPFNEAERLADLQRFKILDTLPEEDFNDLVELVAQICNCPIASITFIDKDRQWFKAKKNITDSEGSRKDAFCSHTIMEEKILLVENTSLDSRFANNPHVTSGLKIGFYAGVPIKSSNGYALGSVCAIDKVPRTLSSDQISALEKIARQVSRLLDLRLKNNEIIETTERLVKADQLIAQFNMKANEEDKLQTAFILHEEIAQSAAAIRLYINHVRDAEEISNPYLDHSVTELEKLRASVTQLSRGLSPTTMANDNYSAYIYSAIEDWAKNTSTKVKLNKEFIEELNGELGLNVFRIVQDILRLARFTQSESLHLSMKAEDSVYINVTFHTAEAVSTVPVLLHEANIMTRVSLLKGTLNKKTGKNTKEEHTISIEIPL